MAVYPASADIRFRTALHTPVQLVNRALRSCIHVTHGNLLLQRHELRVRVHCEEVWTILQELFHFCRLRNTCAMSKTSEGVRSAGRAAASNICIHRHCAPRGRCFALLAPAGFGTLLPRAASFDAPFFLQSALTLLNSP